MRVWPAVVLGFATGLPASGLVAAAEPQSEHTFRLAEGVEDGTLSLKVKHFNPDFTAWEDQETFVRFPLVRVEPERLYFSGLTLKREGSDRLTIFIVLQRGGGGVGLRRGAWQQAPGGGGGQQRGDEAGG